MTPEDRASKAIAQTIAEGRGKNIAFYLARAIREAEEDIRKQLRGKLAN